MSKADKDVHSPADMDPEEHLQIIHYIVSIPRDTAVHPRTAISYRNDEPGTVVKGKIVPIEIAKPWNSGGRYYVYDALDADSDRFRVAADLEGDLTELSDDTREMVDSVVDGMDEIVHVLPHAVLTEDD